MRSLVASVITSSFLAGPVLSATETGASAADEGLRRWLAGDHHVHSRFSARYTADPAQPQTPPQPELGGDGDHTITQNAQAARRFGLRWMVSTDHGGPGHSVVNAEQAYPAMLDARASTPELILFWGMEFDTPGAEHSSLIIPLSAHEREALRHIESRYGRREPWPEDPARDRPELMIEALRDMATMTPTPVVVTNHPSRSATGLSHYGQVRPAQLRDWADAAPGVIIGMEGAPGHQADGLFADGRPDPSGSRGIYRRHPTHGGFDQMTARLGGVWDSLLGEGRRWWITATSDSHTNVSEGGDDFWPGEYAKTYVWARPEGADILDGLREGRIFVVTGDLVTGLEMTVRAAGRQASIGGELSVRRDEATEITVVVRPNAKANAAGRRPEIDHIDLIIGDIEGPATGRDADVNASTRVERRFTARDWSVEGETIILRHQLAPQPGPVYVRLRGTNTTQAEPEIDTPGEDPWSDLWFYSNPIFILRQAEPS